MSGEALNLIQQAEALLAHTSPEQGVALIDEAIERGDAEQAAADREAIAQLERSGKALGFPIKIVRDDTHRRTVVYLVLSNGELSDFYGEHPGDCVAGAMKNLRAKLEGLIRGK